MQCRQHPPGGLRRSFVDGDVFGKRLDLDANRIILLDRVTTNEQETEQIPF